jgi:tRNA(fMet)-specific endonuclease VapC
LLFLLDTSTFSELMRAEPDIVIWLASLPDEDRVVICPVVRGEIQFGISRLAEGKRRAALEAVARRLSASVACEPVPETAGDRYAAIKLARQRQGLSLDENDLWIAATALALNATLVSRDQDFTGIENRRVVQPA